MLDLSLVLWSRVGEAISTLLEHIWIKKIIVLIVFLKHVWKPTKFRLEFTDTHHVSMLDLNSWENLVVVQPIRSLNLGVWHKFGKDLDFPWMGLDYPLGFVV